MICESTIIPLRTAPCCKAWVGKLMETVPLEFYHILMQPSNLVNGHIWVHSLVCLTSNLDGFFVFWILPISNGRREWHTRDLNGIILTKDFVAACVLACDFWFGSELNIAATELPDRVCSYCWLPLFGVGVGPRERSTSFKALKAVVYCVDYIAIRAPRFLCIFIENLIRFLNSLQPADGFAITQCVRCT
jgi:hypothetical protein